MLKNSDEVTYFKQNMSIKVRHNLLEFTDTIIMGILNVTPDSFYEKSRVVSESDILMRAEKMLIEGADILDIGGYSSRPGANEVPIITEKERIVKATKLIRKNFPNAILSLDTFRSEVAEVGLDAGIDLINDISAGNLDPELPKIVAKYDVPYIIMHMKGDPKTMSNLTDYENIMKEIILYFSQKIELFRNLGIKDIIIDPGFGFSKTVEQNFEIIQKFSMLQSLECPILAGISRKSFIQKTLGVSSEDTLVGTNVLHTILSQKGANILRTHDVKETKQCLTLLEASSLS